MSRASYDSWYRCLAVFFYVAMIDKWNFFLYIFNLDLFNHLNERCSMHAQPALYPFPKAILGDLGYLEQLLAESRNPIEWLMIAQKIETCAQKPEALFIVQGSGSKTLSLLDRKLSILDYDAMTDHVLDCEGMRVTVPQGRSESSRTCIMSRGYEYVIGYLRSGKIGLLPDSDRTSGLPHLVGITFNLEVNRFAVVGGLCFKTRDRTFDAQDSGSVKGGDSSFGIEFANLDEEITLVRSLNGAPVFSIQRIGERYYLFYKD